MLFEKRPRLEGLTWTSRKIKSFENRTQRQQEKLQKKYPLFADLVELPETITPEDEFCRREGKAIEIEQEWRDRIAKQWRRARADYFACSDQMRAEIRAYWKNWRGPRSVLNFGYVVEQFNGVAEVRRQQSKENEKAMLMRIYARLSSQNTLPFS